MANTTFSGPVRSENGFQNISKDATTGTVTTGSTYGNIITGSIQSLSGAGAVNTTDLITEITSTGTDALTLANGSAGQVKIIVMIVDGGDATLTPTTLAGGSTITFGDVGDGVILVYNTTTGWNVVGNNGAVIA